MIPAGPSSRCRSLRRWEPRSTGDDRCRPERRALSGALAPFISVGEQENEAWRSAVDTGPDGTLYPATCGCGALAGAGGLGGCASASASSCGLRMSTSESSWTAKGRDQAGAGRPIWSRQAPLPVVGRRRLRSGRIRSGAEAGCSSAAPHAVAWRPGCTCQPGERGLRCRRCWGLSYESQKWSYHGDWWARLPNYTTTERQREERRAEARLRYARRRRYVA